MHSQRNVVYSVITIIYVKVDFVERQITEY